MYAHLKHCQSLYFTIRSQLEREKILPLHKPEDEDTYYHAKVYLEPVSARMLHPSHTTIKKAITKPPVKSSAKHSLPSDDHILPVKPNPKPSNDNILPAKPSDDNILSAKPADDNILQVLPDDTTLPANEHSLPANLSADSTDTNYMPSDSSDTPSNTNSTTSQLSAKALDSSTTWQHTCKICGVKYAHRASLFKHVRKVHPNETTTGNIKCREDTCTFTCRYLAGLRKHLQQVHSIPMEAEEIDFRTFEGTK